MPRPDRKRGGRRSEGGGRTLPAEERPWHKAYSGSGPVPRRTAWKQEKERRAAEAAGRPPKAGTPGPKQPRRNAGPSVDGPELLVGRNPVVEALRAGVPGRVLYVALGIDIDNRVNEIVRTATERELPVRELDRIELDRMTGGARHQGVGLQVPPYEYEPFEDLLAAAAEATAPLLVALDGVTDPHNLGAVIRSAAAFGAAGVFLPQRRAAGVTAGAWKASAGAAARLPVSRVTNLTRAVKACQQTGFLVVGLDPAAGTELFQLPAADSPLVVVVGSEGRGLSRLVGETCDLRVAIPMASGAESLNASVAAGVALAEVTRQRGAAAS